MELELLQMKTIPFKVPIPSSGGTPAEAVTIEVNVYTDPQSGTEVLTPESADLIEKTKARHTGLMSADELKALRKRMNLSQRQMSQLLQIGEKSYTRWEAGHSPPSRSMNLLLSALRDGRIDVTYSKAINHGLLASMPNLNSLTGKQFTFFGRPRGPYEHYKAYQADDSQHRSAENVTQTVSENRRPLPIHHKLDSYDNSNSQTSMDILVNFDDLTFAMKRGGLELLCSRVVSSIASTLNTIPPKCRFRFYGNWYDKERLTPDAKQLIHTIEENGSALVVPCSSARRGNVLVRLEMAYALEIAPNRALNFGHETTAEFTSAFANPHNAERNKREHNAITPNSPSLTSPLSLVLSNVRQDDCPGPSRDLSDAMLAADLIFLARNAIFPLALVSAGPGTWMGVQMALLSGARLIHMNPESHLKRKLDFTFGPGKYTHTTLY